MKTVKDIKALKVITVEELRTFDGLENVSDAEANHIINTLKELSLLTHNIVTNNEQSKSVSKIRKAE